MHAPAGHHLVEDEERAVALGDCAETLEESGVGRDDAHVPGDRLDEDGGDVVPRAAKSASTAARSLNGATSVSATVAGVTPGESGRPSVATPEPAAASSASAWPW